MGPSCRDVAMFTLPERLHIDRRAGARRQRPAAAPAGGARSRGAASRAGRRGAAGTATARRRERRRRERFLRGGAARRTRSFRRRPQTGSAAPALAAAAAARGRPRAGEAAGAPGRGQRLPAPPLRTAPGGDRGRVPVRNAGEEARGVPAAPAQPRAGTGDRRRLPRGTPRTDKAPFRGSASLGMSPMGFTQATTNTRTSFLLGKFLGYLL